MYDIGLKIKATDRTPLLEYKPREGVFNMIGVSVPDDANKFYEPIINWIIGYVELNKAEPITVNIELDYFSIKSSKNIVRILKEFSTLPNVTVNWYYDDPDIKEVGQDLSYIVNVNFNLIEKKNGL